MNIFYASEYKYQIQWNSRLWYFNHYLPLKDLGHALFPFDYNITPHYQMSDTKNIDHLRFINKHRSKLEDALLKQVKEAHKKHGIDLFFSYFWISLCRPEIIREIKSLGILTVNWFCNAAHQFYLIKDLAPAYDYCLVPEKFRIDDYKSINANPYYFPEAANPHIFKPYNFTKEFDATFVGKRYGDRYDIISYLHQNGIPVHVWGDGWKNIAFLSKAKNYSFFYLIKKALQRGVSLFNQDRHVSDRVHTRFLHGVLSDEEYIKIYSRSKIAIGLSTCGDTHLQEDERILQIRLRDIEAPMSGAFYITEYIDELSDCFEIGKEIVCYESEEDLLEKLKYYLKKENEREKIRLAGYKRAVSEHTCQKRFETLFATILCK